MPGFEWFRQISFEVARIQARRASKCITNPLEMHSLARRACIENRFVFSGLGRTASVAAQ